MGALGGHNDGRILGEGYHKLGMWDLGPGTVRHHDRSSTFKLHTITLGSNRSETTDKYIKSQESVLWDEGRQQRLEYGACPDTLPLFGLSPTGPKKNTGRVLWIYHKFKYWAFFALFSPEFLKFWVPGLLKATLKTQNLYKNRYKNVSLDDSPELFRRQRLIASFALCIPGVLHLEFIKV